MVKVIQTHLGESSSLNHHPQGWWDFILGVCFCSVKICTSLLIVMKTSVIMICFKFLTFDMIESTSERWCWDCCCCVGEVFSTQYTVVDVGHMTLNVVVGPTSSPNHCRCELMTRDCCCCCCWFDVMCALSWCWGVEARFRRCSHIIFTEGWQ